MAGLRRLVEVDGGEEAHAGVDPVDAGAARQQGEQLGLAGGDPLKGRRRQRQPLATPGDRLHRLAGQVAVTAERDQGGRSSVGAVWLGWKVECTVDTLRATLPHYATTSDREARGPDGT
jgi:hypothetical protein